jgi:hypothetical protein
MTILLILQSVLAQAAEFDIGFLDYDWRLNRKP